MGKKKFSSGLDSLFDAKDDQHELDLQRELSDVRIQGDQRTTSVQEMPSIRRASNKNFTSDLDSLFQDAFTDSVEEKAEKLRRLANNDDPFESNRRQYKQPLSGLDALIRSTMDTSLAEFDHAPVKRLTIMFENLKIEKLKSIAKMERSFVKDLVGGVLTEFINDYEKRSGKSL